MSNLSIIIKKAEKEKLKEDIDCERLKKLLEISTESLIYVCYKLQKYQDCVYYLEHSKYLLNLDTRNLTEILLKRNMDPLKLIETENVSLIQNFEELVQVQRQISDPLIIFKFIFENKLFYYKKMKRLINHVFDRHIYGKVENKKINNDNIITSNCASNSNEL